MPWSFTEDRKLLIGITDGINRSENAIKMRTRMLVKTTTLEKLLEQELFILQNYKEYTALEAIRKVDGGRHFEDGILKIWNDNGLDLGWMNKVLKDVS